MQLKGRTEDVKGNHTGYFYIELPLRELFAAFALAGLSVGPGTRPEVAAQRAYEHAEAMLDQYEGEKS